MMKKVSVTETPTERLFKSIQRFLVQPPLIIWGSGATAPCGLPTMHDLALHLKKTVVPDLDVTKNFERELGDERYDEVLDQIRQEI